MNALMAGGGGPDEGRTTPVSVIATMLNEGETVRGWLEALSAQTRPPDEVVVVDAGSTDTTVNQLRTWARQDPRLRVLVCPGANRSEGRNAAIREARGPIIASTDAGTVWERDWLEHLRGPLTEPRIAVSSGFFRPAGHTWFQYVLSTIITPRLSDTNPDRFLPSSRSVAFRKEWWEKAGGYPEWLLTGEDLVFDLSLKRCGARFAFAPNAVVRWYPPASLRGFFHQYLQYARGDGHALLWPWRHAMRYSAYICGIVLLAGSRRSVVSGLTLIMGAGIYLRKFARRLAAERPWRSDPQAIGAYVLLPVVVVTGDLAKMIGYPRGRWERWRAAGPSGLPPSR